MMTAQPVFRFAPSPNGLLHLGHALSALLNFGAARLSGGRFLLRIEDIDPQRTQERHVSQIFDDLAWLGLAWEEPVRRQSQHLGQYRAALEGLKARELVYPCFCSRAQIARALATGEMQRDPDGAPHYPGTCRHLSETQIAARLDSGQRPAWRLDMARALALATPSASNLFWCEQTEPQGGPSCREAARPERWGDVILGRSEVATSYHLSVVLDDAVQGVTHVVRGRDLFSATGLHRLLQVLLGLPAPFYHHHRLIVDRDGQKLSKSRHSASLKALREAGATREDILASIGLDDEYGPGPGA